MPEVEFEPCRPDCQTCKPGLVLSAPAMRWYPTGAPYPIGPSVEPYDGRLPVVVAPLRSGKTTAYLAQSKPVPRRPLFAGLIRRLLP